MKRTGTGKFSSSRSKRFFVCFTTQEEGEAGEELLASDYIREKMEESYIYVETECAFLREVKGITKGSVMYSSLWGYSHSSLHVNHYSPHV